MKFNILAALLIVGITVRAYEEENLMGPGWGDRVKQRASAQINRTSAEKYQRNTIYTPQELEEKIDTIVNEPERTAAQMVQHPAELVDAESSYRIANEKEMKNTTTATELPESPFYIRHRNKLIIGGVVLTLFVVGARVDWSSKSE